MIQWKCTLWVYSHQESLIVHLLWSGPKAKKWYIVAILAVLVPFHTALFALVRTSWNEPKCSHVTTSASLVGYSLNAVPKTAFRLVWKSVLLPNGCFPGVNKDRSKMLAGLHTAIMERQLRGLILSLIITLIHSFYIPLQAIYNFWEWSTYAADK